MQWVRLALVVLIISGYGLLASCSKNPAESQESSQQTASTGTNTSQALAALPIILPKPQYRGTPTNLSGVENLEAPLGHPRPDFLAPKGVTNVALGKPVITENEPIMGQLSQIVDGDKEATDGSVVELFPLKQYIQIDLEAPHEIFAILFWHYHKDQRAYFDVVVQVADDPDFITNVRTLFNNDTDNSAGLGVGTDMHYVDTSEGRLVDAKGVIAQYVRLYSNGNSQNDRNHYLEVEVYGRPAP